MAARCRGEPCLEAGAVAERHPLEQLPTQRGNGHRVHPRAGSNNEHIDHGVRWKRYLERITSHGCGIGELFPQRVEGPTQRAERVVGFGEEKGCESRSAHRRRAEEEIREDRPRLVPARRRYRGAVAEDDRTAQKPDLYGRASIIEPLGRGGKGLVGRSNEASNADSGRRLSRCPGAGLVQEPLDVARDLVDNVRQPDEVYIAVELDQRGLGDPVPH